MNEIALKIMLEELKVADAIPRVIERLIAKYNLPYDEAEALANAAFAEAEKAYVK